MTKDVTILGTGRLGAAVARRLAGRGYRLTLWNRTASTAESLAEELGPPAASVADVVDAVSSAELVLTVLTDGRALREVLIASGALSSLTPDALLLDLSTIDPVDSAHIAAACHNTGTPFVRVGVSGTSHVVEAGNAGLLISGDAEATISSTPFLSDISPTVHTVGTGEEAKVAKLAVNLLLAGTLEALGEAVVASEVAGLHRDVLLTAMESTVLASPFLAYKGSALRNRDYAPTFTTADLRKDVSMLLTSARRHGVQLKTAERLHEQLDDTCAAGWADADCLSLVRLTQMQSGRKPD
jgi:3-hydroxyisobutyrate dehydrogenase-like beta-hydroxyacid dehydrogenase